MARKIKRPNNHYICCGCQKDCMEDTKNKFFKEELCRECYQAWDDLDRKGQAYLKEMRCHGEFI